MSDAYQPNPSRPAQTTSITTVPLRTQIAIEAMAALLSTGDNYTDASHPEGGWEWYVDAAVEIADMMVKKLEK